MFYLFSTLTYTSIFCWFSIVSVTYFAVKVCELDMFCLSWVGEGGVRFAGEGELPSLLKINIHHSCKT